MAGLVHVTSGERATYIIQEMPLKMVFAFEHLYYLQNGYDCKVMSFEQSLEDLLSSL